MARVVIITIFIILKERRTPLLDLYTAADSHDGKSLAAYRKGKFNLIQGSYKDAHWYSEPSEDRVKTSDEGLLARVYGMYGMVP